MFITRRFVIVAALAAGLGLLLPLRSGALVTALTLNAVLVLVMLVDVFVAPSIKSIRVQRQHPPVVVVGTTAAVSWKINNRSSRTCRISVADGFVPSLNAAQRRVTTSVKPQATVVATTTITPERRGRFDLSHVVLRTLGPLGLGGRQGRAPVSSQIRVHPAFRSRKDAELRVRKARTLAVGLRTIKGQGEGSEFEQLRDYTPDDEFRKIDWAATARTGKHIVRTYRPERNQTIIVMLDAGRLMAAKTDGVPRIEHAMDAVMALGAVATRLGDKIGLMVFDTEIRSVVAPARHRDQVTRMTEAMFDVEPVLATSDYRTAFSGMLRRFRRRALVVMLTELSEQAVEDAMIPAINLVRRTHVVIVASVSDAEVNQWAAATPHDETEVYRRAASVQALQERRRAGSKLSSSGVRVIDAAPGVLAGALADAYLQIKGSGAL